MKEAAGTYYDMLGLSPEATDADVRRAYRALALRWHPDRNPQNVAMANYYTSLLNSAYAHLRTAPQRRAYDRMLAAQAQKTVRQTGTNRQSVNGAVSMAATPRKVVAVGGEKTRMERKPTMWMLIKEIFWPLAPAPQEMMRHG